MHYEINFLGSFEIATYIARDHIYKQLEACSIWMGLQRYSSSSNEMLTEIQTNLIPFQERTYSFCSQLANHVIVQSQMSNGEYFHSFVQRMKSKFRTKE